LTSDKPKKRTLKDVLVYLASIALAGAFLYFAFRGVEFSALLDILAGASPWWILALLAAQTLSHWFRAMRWKALLGSSGKNATVNSLFGAVMIGYGVNGVVPRLGEVTRAVIAGKAGGLSSSSALGSIVVERVIDLLFFGAAVVASGFLYHGDLYEAFPWLETSIYVGAAFVFVAIVGLALMIRLRDRFVTLVGAVIAWAGKIGARLVGVVSASARESALAASEKLAEKIGGMMGRIVEGFGSMRGAGNYAYVFFLSGAIIALYAVVSWFGFFALHMAGVSFAEAWIMMAIGSIGVMIPTPGGVGSYHALAKSVATGLFGLTARAGLAYATLVHGATYLLHAALAVVYALVVKLYYKREATRDEITNETA
jgi:glycosyltransferase 2 family protein